MLSSTWFLTPVRELSLCLRTKEDKEVGELSIPTAPSLLHVPHAFGWSLQTVFSWKDHIYKAGHKAQASPCSSPLFQLLVWPDAFSSTLHGCGCLYSCYRQLSLSQSFLPEYNNHSWNSVAHLAGRNYYGGKKETRQFSSDI